jgi:hypothetical protein
VELLVLKDAGCACSPAVCAAMISFMCGTLREANARACEHGVKRSPHSARVRENKREDQKSAQALAGGESAQTACRLSAILDRECKNKGG